MRLLSRLVCTLVGHRPRGGQATFDESDGRFVDVAKTQYAVCTRCGDVRPAPLTVVEGDEDQDAIDGQDDVGRTDATTETADPTRPTEPEDASTTTETEESPPGDDTNETSVVADAR